MEKTLAPITTDINIYGKFTMDVPVTKVWNDNNNQGTSKTRKYNSNTI